MKFIKEEETAEFNSVEVISDLDKSCISGVMGENVQKRRGKRNQRQGT